VKPHPKIYKYFSPFLVGLFVSAGIWLERKYNKLQGGSISGDFSNRIIVAAITEI